MAFKMKGHALPGPHQRKSGVDLTRKNGGPKATPKPSKEVAGDVDLSPGFEDPIKIQKVQREGLVPGPRMADKAFLKSQNESEVKRSDLDEKGKKLWDSKRTKKSPAKQGLPGGDAGEAIDHWKKYKKGLKKAKKKVTKVAKKVAKKAIRKIPIVTLGSMLIGKTASADQPGTGTHGGKKQTYYNPKTGKYE